MKKISGILALTLLTVAPLMAQKKMEKREFSPWQWQEKLSYV